MRFEYNLKVSFFILLIVFVSACKNEKERGIQSEELAVQEESITEISYANENVLQSRINHYICYTCNSEGDLMLSIAFDEKGRAAKVKYNDRKVEMSLKLVRAKMDKGDAVSGLDTYYSEIVDGKETGKYRLKHSGIWDYAEYTRVSDGKVLKFTIDHKMTTKNGGYRTTPCF